MPPAEPPAAVPAEQPRREAEEPAPARVAHEPAVVAPEPPAVGPVAVGEAQRERPSEQSAAVGEGEPEPAFGPERALAVLEGALDTLGSAHHRPFSRG